MNDDFIALLHKQLAGEITPSELGQLKAWRRQSPTNEQAAQAYEAVWEQAGHYGLPTFLESTIDLDADFAALQGRLGTETPQPMAAAPTLTVRRFRPALQAAAAVALLVSAYWGWRQWVSPQATAPAFVERHNASTPKQLLVLADGSRVWLREGAHLRYAPDFGRNQTRTVSLQGEAYFEVAHDPARPFRVALATDRYVEVLGTEFGISATAPDAPTTVLVRSGKVRFVPNAVSEAAVLTAGKKAVLLPNEQILRISEPSNLNELAWQSGRLEFFKTPLTQALADIERHYGVQIALHNPALRDCPYTAAFNPSTVDATLETLAGVFHCTLEKTGPTQFRLTGGQCERKRD